MRKRVTARVSPDAAPAGEGWLDLERLAEVEVTSEDAARPAEAALIPGGGPGWLAAHPGEQTLRLLFDEPQRVRRVRLVFTETGGERTQEFVLRWSADGGVTYRDVVRQQWNFSPPDATREVEDYGVDLSGVTALELRTIPDIGGGGARVSLEQLRLA